MKCCLLFLIMLAINIYGNANAIFSGTVIDSVNHSPVEAVTVQLIKNNEVLQTTISDASGKFEFNKIERGTFLLSFNHYAYKYNYLSIHADTGAVVIPTILLSPGIVKLKEITLTGIRKPGLNTFSAIDFTIRPHNSSQDLLRFVPGLFIAQHAGGGKAEQIFLRGFDLDHGTDIRISVDEMPVNMVSHAHGQGYADLHFLIPETVRKIDFAKGPYNADAGDLATAGTVKFNTYDCLPSSMVKVEGGRFNTYRALAMVKLLNNDNKQKVKGDLYNATEYYFTNGYTINPQHLNRFNTFFKYNASLSSKTHLKASASWFRSGWDASGQIPERLVNSGSLSRFGSVDPSEGGITSRKNLNVQLNHAVSGKSEFQHQIWFTDYRFDLFSNFTFYLKDSINGDQIRQKEKRFLCGYNGFYKHSFKTNTVEHETKAGAGLRFDNVFNSELSRTVKRQFLSNVQNGDIKEVNLFFYLDHTIYFSKKLTAIVGLRYDHFVFSYNDKLKDTSVNAVSSGIVSPKLNLYYTPSAKVSFFLKGGKGFHSNDARVVIYESRKTLPAAWGSDIGSTFKLFRGGLFTVAFWYLYMQDEFVYVGDEGIIESGGRSERKGIDVSGRVQLTEWIFADVDVNISRPRLLDANSDENHIPLAPAITSIGGVTINPLKNMGISLRYRYLGDRPANETNSVTAKGYFLTDLVVNYQWNDWQVSVTGENLLNRKWKEAQFDTESRLLNESMPVSEIHFTPGTPIFLKLSVLRKF